MAESYVAVLFIGGIDSRHLSAWNQRQRQKKTHSKVSAGRRGGLTAQLLLADERDAG
jgi:hypothetical protein